MRKLFFILTTAVLLIATACSGSFIDPGMLDQLGGDGSSGGSSSSSSEGDSDQPIGSGAYTITFNINGGTGTTPSPRKGNLGQAITLPNGSGFSKSGYTFVCWNTYASGIGTNYNPGASYTVYNNVTLYAVWKIPPTISNSTNPIPLTAGIWSDGNITSESPNLQAWYSFSVTSGTTYYIWWNDKGSGNNTKTLDIMVSAYYNDNTSVSNFTNVDSAWSTPRSFTSNSTGTVKLKVVPYSNNSTGTTFAIVYSTTNSRP